MRSILNAFRLSICVSIYYWLEVTLSWFSNEEKEEKNKLKHIKEVLFYRIRSSLSFFLTYSIYVSHYFFSHLLFFPLLFNKKGASACAQVHAKTHDRLVPLSILWSYVGHALLYLAANKAIIIIPCAFLHHFWIYLYNNC